MRLSMLITRDILHLNVTGIAKMRDIPLKMHLRGGQNLANAAKKLAKMFEEVKK